MNLTNRMLIRIFMRHAVRNLSVSGDLSVNSLSTNGFNFELNDTQREIIEVAKKFTREEIVPKSAYYDEKGEFPEDIMKKAWKLGLSGNLTIPKHLGGLGQSVFNVGLIQEQFYWGCAGIGLACLSSRVGQTPVIMYGNKEQQKKYLGRLLEEPLTVGYAITEAKGGSDVGGIMTSAVKKGDEYILNGQKTWITHGGVANWYFVLARTDPDPKAKASKAFTGFIVERDWPGVQPGRKENMMGQRASDTRSINFQDVRIPIGNVLMGEGAGFVVAMKTLDRSRPDIAAGATGLARRCLDEASKYALERKAFGIPIAQHQAVAFMLADMAIGVNTSRLAWMKSAWEIDRGMSNTLSASIAKTYASDVANKCAADAVQIFGGNGYSKEYPVEKLVRDAKIFQIYEGTNQILRTVVAKNYLMEIQGSA